MEFLTRSVLLVDITQKRQASSLSRSGCARQKFLKAALDNGGLGAYNGSVPNSFSASI